MNRTLSFSVLFRYFVIINTIMNDLKNKSYLCPPLSSVKLCFQTPPRQTFTSNPSEISCPSGGSNFAELP